MKVILLLFLLTYSLDASNSEPLSQKIVVITEVSHREQVLSYIKSHEGFSKKVYRCLGNKRTIGFGHCLRSNETYSYLTYEKAGLLLDRDFKECEDLARKETSNENQKLAIAHFIYCLGIGNYKKSTFRKKLLAGKDIIDILKWCKIKGKKYKTLENARIYEYGLYYRPSSYTRRTY
jgi:lysozyme